MIEDRPIYYRDRLAGCSRTLPHLLSKIVLEWPFAIFSTCIFSITIYFGCLFYVGLPIGDFFYFWLQIFLTNEVAASFAGTVAALSPTMDIAISLGPMMLIMLFMFAGFLIIPSALPVYWRFTIRYLSFFTYSFAGLAQNCFLGTNNKEILNIYELLELSKWENTL
eukprot:Awhi_evm1s13395